MRTLLLSVTAVAVLIAVAPAGAGVDANRAAARRTAKRLFASVQLPAGTQPEATDPSGGVIGANAARPSSPDAVTELRYFRIPGSWQALADRLQAHPPPGTRVSGSAASGRAGGQLVSRLTDFSVLRPVPGVSAAGVEVSLAAAKGGGAALRVSAWAIWLLPRPAWERIPASAAGSVQVLVEQPGGSRSLAATVSSPAGVRALVTFINGLQRFQPGVRSCPLDTGPSYVLRFLAAGGAQVVAQTAQGPCGAVALTVGRRAGPALVDPADGLAGVLWRIGGLPPCTAVQLQTTAAPPAHLPGSEWLTLQLRFRNVSSTPCSLRGTPQLQFFDTTGKSLPTRIPSLAYAAPVATLAPRSAAEAQLTWRLPSQSCVGPTVASIQARLPRVSAPLTVAIDASPRPLAPCGGRALVGPVLRLPG
ncbi:MAG TPA: DUF4232 domain-containing protein [Solirubrobacteraceae bacterium]